MAYATPTALEMAVPVAQSSGSAVPGTRECHAGGSAAYACARLCTASPGGKASTGNGSYIFQPYIRFDNFMN